MKAALAALLALVAAQIPPWDQPTLTTAPAALAATPADGERVGALTYAGGLYLTASSSRFGGVSGLEAQETAEGETLFSAVTDAGDFAQFKGRFDQRLRLIGAEDLKLAELRDDRGQPFFRKADGDAEDISLLPDRPGFLVSFERTHRIVAYEDPMKRDAAQVRVDIPAPMRRAKANTGIEAVAALPGGVVAVGAEDGRIWLCPRGNLACTQIADNVPFEVGPGWNLSSFDHLANGELVAVYRTKAILAHWNAKIVHIKVVDGKATYTQLADMRAWLGNMEGITALPLPDGRGWRLYLISDNAFEATEPTLLLAFDWRS